MAGDILLPVKTKTERLEMKDITVFDCEVYRNYFLCIWKSTTTGELDYIELKDRNLKDFEKEKLNNMLDENFTIGFNSLRYDIPVLCMILKYKRPIDAFKMSQDIIVKRENPHDLLQKYHLNVGKLWEHSDIFKICSDSAYDSQNGGERLRLGLKMYGAKLHFKKVQELPFDPSRDVNEDEMNHLFSYCTNDILTTIRLYEEVGDKVLMRRLFSRKYKVNAFSDSNPIVVEKILRKVLNYYNVAPYSQREVKYTPTGCINFQTENYKDFFQNVTKTPLLPSTINRLKFTDNQKYTLSINGLKTVEKNVMYQSGLDEVIIEKKIIDLNHTMIQQSEGMVHHLKVRFKNALTYFIKERDEARKNYEYIESEGYELILNTILDRMHDSISGTNKYTSILFNTECFINNILNSQLCILMLIERLNNCFVSNPKILHVNGDSICVLLKKKDLKTFERVVLKWSNDTKLFTKNNKYDRLFIMNSNNYFFIRDKEVIKKSGVFKNKGLTVNPRGYIIKKAVMEYIANNTPIEDTVMHCNKIEDFIFIEHSRSGALYNGEYIGKVVRWIYIKDGYCLRDKNNSKLKLSDGCVPVMELGVIPKNLDRGKYIDMAYKMLNSMKGG